MSYPVGFQGLVTLKTVRKQHEDLKTDPYKQTLDIRALYVRKKYQMANEKKVVYRRVLPK
jgi:hypothetical protein